MQRKRLLIALLALAAVIVAAMLAIFLLTEHPLEDLPTAGVVPTADETAATPQITLPLHAPTVSPTLSPDAVLPTEEITPINTVKRYLDRWNAKDAEGMDACLVESHREQRDHELENLDSIEVLRIIALSEAETQAGFPEEIAGDAHAKSLVMADFTVHYSEAGKAFFMADSSTRVEYKFWLVQRTEDDPWLIALQGY